MPSRAAFAVALGVVAVCAAACSGGTAGTASSAPTTRFPPPPPGPTTTVDPACVHFRGSTSTLQSQGPTNPGLLVDATAGEENCLDLVRFTFKSLGSGLPPGYVVRYVDPVKEPFLDGDPPSPISLPGDAFLLVKITPALSTNPLSPDRPSTYLGNLTLRYGDHHHLQIVRELRDGENSIMWAIGLDAKRPFVVDRAMSPPRVTVYIG